MLDVTEAMIPAGDGEGDDTHYVVAGTVVPRPAPPPVPSTKSLAKDEVWVPTLPAGTVVYVNGRNEGDWEGSIEFGEVGGYVLRFAPPFPAQEVTCQVTVT